MPRLPLDPNLSPWTPEWRPPSPLTCHPFPTRLFLPQGTTYRFRMYAINADNLQSDYSAPTVVNTPLETPLEPRLGTAKSSGGPSSLKISWSKSSRVGGGLMHR